MKGGRMQVGRWIVLTLCFFLIDTVSAQQLKETLPFEGEPVNYWLAVIEGGRFEFLPADLEKRPRSIQLSTYAAGLTEGSLVSGVTVLEGGRVISSSLHSPWVDDLLRESTGVAHEKKRELLRVISLREQRVKDLEIEMSSLNVKIRHAAGLGDVDRIYAKIRELDVALEELDKAHNDISELQKKFVSER